jgi:hypothetical protein
MIKIPALRKGRMPSAPTKSIIVVYFLLFTFYFLPFTFAQLTTSTNPEQVADDAVTAWLETEPTDLMSLASRSPEEVCQELPTLLSNPAPPTGTTVNFEDRLEQPSDDPTLKRYTYPAALPNGRLEIVEVQVRQQPAKQGETTSEAEQPTTPEAEVQNSTTGQAAQNTESSTSRDTTPVENTTTSEDTSSQITSNTSTTWQAERVSYQSLQQPNPIRQWLLTPTASIVFIAFTLYVLYLLFRPTLFLRKWLAQGRDAVRAHRGLVIGTMIALYTIFGLGALTGSSLPKVCQGAVREVVTTAVTLLGATDAYSLGSTPDTTTPTFVHNIGEVATAAALTFYQNFVMVTLSFLFGSSLLLGIPGYLLSAASFFTQGVPFGLLGTANASQLVFVVILLLLELTSYFLVVAGGGMLLVTVVRKGFKGFGEGVRKLALMLPFAMLLLLLGAWYEAGIIILPQLLAK